MSENYEKGIAFVLEGTTEKVFYCSFFKWHADRLGCKFERLDSVDPGDIIFEWISGDEKILIKFNVVGAISQIVNSGKWFKNKCVKKHKIPWKVFLCYDTDSPDDDITKFYQGDWNMLRREMKRARAQEIVDLAARADIEDVMLCDLESICNYLGIEPPAALQGKKGKKKMKALYRLSGMTYHEGDRAANMIKNLDFEKIMRDGPIPLEKLVEELE